MHEDLYYILICLLVFISTLAFRLYLVENRKKTIVIHISILVVYSLFCWYELKNNGTGGSSLVWLVGWMFLIGLHWVIQLKAIIILIIKRSKKNNCT
jgi:hypothetical protein